MSKNFKVKNGLETTNISASSNISASGTISANAINVNGTDVLTSVSGNTFATDLKIGRDADNLIDFTTDNQIQFRVNAGNELKLNNAALFPVANDGHSLGAAGLAFSDLFLADAAVINFNNGEINLTQTDAKLVMSGSGVTTLEVLGNVSGSSTSTGSFGNIVGNSISLPNNSISGDVVEGGTIASITISQLGGALDVNNENITNIDVDSGTIDGTVIGGASAAAGTFTTLNATSLNVTSITSSIVTSSILKTEGSNIFGDTAADTHTFNGGIIAGNITASGDISASGLIASSLTNLTTLTALGNLDIGPYNFRARTLQSDVGTGTIPISISSTTKCTNLNADLLDDQEGSYYTSFLNATGNITASNISASGTLDITGNVNFDGDLDVDGTTNLDNVDIDGAVDMASRLTIAGHITSSNNISSSGTITSNGGTFTGDTTFGGHIILNADNRLKSDTTDSHNFLEFDDDSGSPENQTILSSVTNVALIVDGNGNNTGQFEVLKAGTGSTATELFRIENDGNTVFTGNVTLAENKAIFFDSTDTFIKSNTGNPEDLVISADEDIILAPDDNIQIEHGATMYAEFMGDERKLSITGEISASAGVTTSHITASGNITASSGTIAGLSGSFRNLDILDNDAAVNPRLRVGRNTSENIQFSVVDNDVRIIADQDSDSNGDHNFTLNRTFDGSGENNFKIQKGGTDQFVIGTGGDITASGNISSSGTITALQYGGNVSGSSTSTGSFGKLLGDGAAISNISATVSGDTFATDLKIGRDSDNHIDFTTDNVMIFNINNASELRLNATALRPHTNNGLALGSTSTSWSDLYLAEGGFITFDNGDAVITQTGPEIELSGSGATRLNVEGEITASGNITSTLTGSFGGIKLNDDKRLQLGTGNDLQIYHNGSNSVISDLGTGDLLINGANVRIRDANDGNTIALFTQGAGVEMRHDNTIRFETSTTGINVTGHISASSHITASGNISSSGIITGEGLVISDDALITDDLEVQGNISGSSASTITIGGKLQAGSKSFLIDRPEGGKLEYGVLEGQQNDVFFRGELKGDNVIYLPKEWEWLVDENTITVQLTSIGKHQELFVKEIKENKIFIDINGVFKTKQNIHCYHIIHGTRKDVELIRNYQ